MATTHTLEGIDVSKWQGDVKWPALSQAGLVFAFARVSDGLHRDGFFEANWPGMRKAGLIRGAYQFFRAGQDPILQAELLLSQVRRLDAGDLPPVLDLEESDGQNAATVLERAREWLRHVEERLGRKPLIYTGRHFWDSLEAGQAFSDYPLWVAHYNLTISQPQLPQGWARWTFWQYSASGRLPGIPGDVDLNRFNGSLEELHALAGLPGTGRPPAPRPAAEASMLQAQVKPPPAERTAPPGPTPLSPEGTPRAETPPSTTGAFAPEEARPPVVPLIPARKATPPPDAPASPGAPAQAPGERPSSPNEASLDTRLRQRLAAPLPEKHQEELAQLLDLREEAANRLGRGAAELADLGIAALLGETPNLPFAQTLRKRLTTRLAEQTRPFQLSALLKADSPPLQVVLGLGVMLVCTTIAGGLAHWKLTSVDWTLFQLPPRLLLLTALGGTVGSVASILVRIRDFEEARGASPASLVLFGLSKPLVGTCFALFALSVLKAQLLPLQLPPEGPGESYFFLAMSFLCGFSERFAQDLVARLEDGLAADVTPADPKEPAPVVPPGTSA